MLYFPWAGGSELPDEITIPDRRAFKASEVCVIAHVQPYVLRSWEAEFPELGVAKTPGGPRIYRRADVERVLQIKQLVYGEGLTLAGARRRLDQASGPVAAITADEISDVSLLSETVKARITAVRQTLKTLHVQLSRAPQSGSLREFNLAPPAGGHVADADAAARRGRRARTAPA